MDAMFALVPKPDHVPDSIVRPFPYILGETTEDDPFAFVRQVHEDYPPIFWAERMVNGIRGAWVPRREEDIRAVFADTEHFTNRDFAPFAKLAGETWGLVPAEYDPPEHGSLRRAVNPMFTPARMAALEQQIRVYARDYIAAFRDRGACEYMSEFAFEFPIKVFLELMGLPQDRDEVAQFMRWENALLHDSDIGKIIASTKAVNAYLAEQCEDRRRHPRDDLLTFAVRAQVDGRPLSDDEITGFCFNLFVGGLDTVSTNLGLQMRFLAENPGHQAQLRADPTLIPKANAELLRYCAPIMNSRECIREVEIAGQRILPGDKVMVSAFLAGRDPEAFDEPEAVRFERNPRHVTFGFGIHTCIGMHLANRELRIGIEEFLAAVPEFRVEPGAKIKSYLAGIVQPINLPLVWKM